MEWFPLQQATADLSEYSESMEWELQGVSGVFHSVKYTCCPNPYHDITYTLSIKRRYLYYAMYLIIPCIMIVILTLLVFLLPPDCNERMTVGELNRSFTYGGTQRHTGTYSKNKHAGRHARRHTNTQTRRHADTLVNTHTHTHTHTHTAHTHTQAHKNRSM